MGLLDSILGGGTGLAAGSRAPDFELEDQDGKRVALADFRGKRNVVLYFYPKDDTPGCTKEACAFRDEYTAFRDAGGLDPMMAGLLGGLLTAWVTFVPSFLWIFLGAPYMERLRGNRNLSGALAAMGASSGLTRRRDRRRDRRGPSGSRAAVAAGALRSGRDSGSGESGSWR